LLRPRWLTSLLRPRWLTPGLGSILCRTVVVFCRPPVAKALALGALGGILSPWGSGAEAIEVEAAPVLHLLRRGVAVPCAMPCRLAGRCAMRHLRGNKLAPASSSPRLHLTRADARALPRILRRGSRVIQPPSSSSRLHLPRADPRALPRILRRGARVIGAWHIQSLGCSSCHQVGYSRCQRLTRCLLARLARCRPYPTAPTPTRRYRPLAHRRLAQLGPSRPRQPMAARAAMAQPRLSPSTGKGAVFHFGRSPSGALVTTRRRKACRTRSEISISQRIALRPVQGCGGPSCSGSRTNMRRTGSLLVSTARRS
jgi:hypothetical protein